MELGELWKADGTEMVIVSYGYSRGRWEADMERVKSRCPGAVAHKEQDRNAPEVPDGAFHTAFCVSVSRAEEAAGKSALGVG